MIKKAMTTLKFDPPLDAGIAHAVAVLQQHGVETFESCEGGAGHAYPEPAARFHGNRAEGLRALALAVQAGLPVLELRRVWRMEDGDVNGPWWELTFHTRARSATSEVAHTPLAPVSQIVNWVEGMNPDRVAP